MMRQLPLIQEIAMSDDCRLLHFRIASTWFACYHESRTVEANRYPNLAPEKGRAAADPLREQNQKISL